MKYKYIKEFNFNGLKIYFRIQALDSYKTPIRFLTHL